MSPVFTTSAAPAHHLIETWWAGAIAGPTLLITPLHKLASRAPGRSLKFSTQMAESPKLIRPESATKNERRCLSQNRLEHSALIGRADEAVVETLVRVVETMRVEAERVQDCRL